MSQRLIERIHEDPILDAARETVMAVGARRATVTEVARRADVSRMTVYRRFPDAEALLRALMTREFASVIKETAAAAPTEGGARGRIVEVAVGGSDRFARHPLFVRLLDVDPELLLPYMTTRVGQVQRLALQSMTDLVAEGMRDGSVRPGDPERTAAAIELALRGWVLSARSEDTDERRTALLDELRLMLDAYLRPEAVPA